MVMSGIYKICCCTTFTMNDGELHSLLIAWISERTARVGYEKTNRSKKQLVRTVIQFSILNRGFTVVYQTSKVLTVKLDTRERVP